MSKLIDQAEALHRKLNNAAYNRLAVYSRLPYYEQRAESDPYVARLNRILGRSTQRIARRMARQRRVGAILERYNP